jgi:hypothetical protein
VETGTPPERSAEARDDAPSERDPDLVALEGLEAEFTELEAELTRVEQARGEVRAEPEPEPERES